MPTKKTGVVQRGARMTVAVSIGTGPRPIRVIEAVPARKRKKSVILRLRIGDRPH